MKEPESKKKLLDFLDERHLVITSEGARKKDEAVHWALLEKHRAKMKHEKESRAPEFRQLHSESFKFILVEVRNRFSGI
jgi:hypothetical protein